MEDSPDPQDIRRSCYVLAAVTSYALSQTAMCLCVFQNQSGFPSTEVQYILFIGLFAWLFQGWGKWGGWVARGKCNIQGIPTLCSL